MRFQHQAAPNALKTIGNSAVPDLIRAVEEVILKQGEQRWVIREKRIRVRGNNRKRPNAVQRRNENKKRKRRNSHEQARVPVKLMPALTSP
jgi:hypothetical protein